MLDYSLFVSVIFSNRLGFNREAKIPAPRMYCDICEEFDQHETEDCPTQCDDAPVINRDSKEKPPPRPYCDICEGKFISNKMLSFVWVRLDLLTNYRCPNTAFYL